MLSAASRALSGIEIVTVLLLCFAYCYGWRDGVLIAVVFSVLRCFIFGFQVYNYYNPTYKDIPVSMIDLVVTDDGDRYVKYDAVTMVEMNTCKK